MYLGGGGSDGPRATSAPEYKLTKKSRSLFSCPESLYNLVGP